MARFSAPVVFLLVVVLTVALKKANGDVAIDESMIAMVGPCLEEHGVNVAEAVIVYRINNNLDSIDPCFFQCLFEKTGSLDDLGNINRDNLVSCAKGVVNNAGDAQEIEAIVDACLTDTVYDCVKSRELMVCLLE